MFKPIHLALLALQALSIAVARPIEDTCNRFYTVQPGDTCDSIGRTQNVPTWQVQFVNSDFIDVNCSNLFPGEQLCLGVVGGDCDQIYVVKPGDTCLFIASFVGLSLEVFLDNNLNVGEDCSIYVGEALCARNIVDV